uniref:Tau-tubulin kinase 1 n=1 Tax=Ascaris suum TaxID=6253 RepID=F1L9H2_ASCSU
MEPEPDDFPVIAVLKEGETLGDWTIREKLGQGSYGAVYTVVNKKGELYAMKTESVKSYNKVLKAEYYVLSELKRIKAQHFCTIIDSGLIGETKYLVMTLVGLTLTELRKYDPTVKVHKFSLGCALSVGIKCLEAIQEIHSVGYLHRDIKPSNYAIGRIEVRQIYLLDFGMCRKYKDNSSNIRNPRSFAAFRGTVRYAPLSCHVAREQCRKDDLESWLYQQVELTTGRLPWKNMKDRDDVGKCKKLCRQKEYVKELLGGCPREYLAILRLIDSLRYYSDPDYARICEYLREAIRNNNVSEYPYDWEMLNEKTAAE